MRAAAGGRRRGVRLRQQPARARRRARRRRRLRLPRLRARLHPPAVLRGQGPVPLGRAVRRPRRHRRTDDAILDLFGDQERSRAGSRWRASASRSRGCRRASAGWATASATCAGLRFNEMVGRGELRGADRHRARPPRHRLGGLARTARPRRCATARTRSPTGRCSMRWSTRLRRHMGVGPPRRRRRHAARRSTPGRCSWPTARGGGRADPPRADGRPRHGRRAPRRCGLAGGDRGGRARRRADADARSATRLSDQVTQICAARAQVLARPRTACRSCATPRRRARARARPGHARRRGSQRFAADLRRPRARRRRRAARSSGRVDCRPPSVRRLARGGTRGEGPGVPYEQSRARGGGSVAAPALARRPTRRCSSRRAAIGPDAGPRHDRLRVGPATACVEGKAAGRPAGPQSTLGRVDGLSPTPSARAMTPAPRWTRSTSWRRACDVDALNMASSRPPSRDQDLARLGAIAVRRGRPAARPRRAVSTPTARCRSAVLAACVRSVDDLACRRISLRPGAAGGDRARRGASCPAPSPGRAGRRRARLARGPDAVRYPRGRDRTATLAPRRVASLPVVIGLAVRRDGAGRCARRWRRACSTRPGCWGMFDVHRLDRAGQAGRPRWRLDAPGRAHPAPVRAQPGASRLRGSVRGRG